ncbi:MAG: DUF2304 domain-containing protein [Deltaproteobacteria bacterium]|nr:DUF2304 domain-containing protein [Deltaproteobacteria bacterium]
MQYFRIFSILCSFIVFFVIIDFIRRGLLKEKYSLLWLASAVSILVLSIKERLLDKTAALLGVGYPPTLLFMIAFIFVILIMLHFSVVISILHEKNKILAQEMTLLKNAVKQAGIDPAGGNPAGGNPAGGNPAGGAARGL